MSGNISVAEWNNSSSILIRNGTVAGKSIAKTLVLCQRFRLSLPLSLRVKTAPPPPRVRASDTRPLAPRPFFFLPIFMSEIHLMQKK